MKPMDRMRDVLKSGFILLFVDVAPAPGG